MAQWKNNVNPYAISETIGQQWDKLVAAKAKVAEERRLLDMLIADELGRGVEWNDRYGKFNVSNAAPKARASAAPSESREDIMSFLNGQRDSGRSY